MLEATETADERNPFAFMFTPVLILLFSNLRGVGNGIVFEFVGRLPVLRNEDKFIRRWLRAEAARGRFRCNTGRRDHGDDVLAASPEILAKAYVRGADVADANLSRAACYYQQTIRKRNPYPEIT